MSLSKIRHAAISAHRLKLPGRRVSRLAYRWTKRWHSGKFFHALTLVLLVGALLPTNCSAEQGDVFEQQDTVEPKVLAETHRSPADTGWVLLTNDRVISGLAYQVGEFVLVRKGGQSEIRLPRKQVACWSNQLSSLYQYKLDHRGPTNAKTHLKDAQWCLDHALWEPARLEIEKAQEKGASPLELVRLRRQLQHGLQPTVTTSTHGSSPKNQLTVSRDSMVTPTHHQEPLTPSFSRELISEFHRSVQLTLINRCGNCHDQKSQRPWQISKTIGGTRPSGRLSRENLLSVLAYIDKQAPHKSPLLTKATTPHGGHAAPLGPRHRKAIEHLKHWVNLASREIAKEPSSDPHELSSTSIRMAQPETVSSAVSPSPISTESDAALESSERHAERNTAWTSQKPSPQDATPKRLPQIKNPFAPELFHRQYQQ